MISAPSPDEFDEMLGAIGRQVKDAVLAERQRCADLCLSLVAKVSDSFGTGIEGAIPADGVRAAFRRAAERIMEDPATAPEARR